MIFKYFDLETGRARTCWDSICSDIPSIDLSISHPFLMRGS